MRWLPLPGSYNKLYIAHIPALKSLSPKDSKVILFEIQIHHNHFGFFELNAFFRSAPTCTEVSKLRFCSQAAQSGSTDDDGNGAQWHKNRSDNRR